MHLEARIVINIGQGEEEAHRLDTTAGLFCHLAAATVFNAFAGVDKATRKVEGAARRVGRAPADKESVSDIEDDSHCGSRRVVIIGEAACPATLRLEIVDLKAGRTAAGTIIE